MAMPAYSQDKTQAADDDAGWVNLLDENAKDGWRPSEFGGPGEVTVESGLISTDVGAPLLGVTFQHPKVALPRDNYEIKFEARRVDGTDFFCGLTFPVQDAHCSLILGGWGGGLVGLSSIDGRDASENETTSYHSFENKRWYRVRLRVSQHVISAWLDGKQIVICNVKDRKLSTRPEVLRSQPLGVATYQTAGEIRNFHIRQLENQ